jgi:hypothetical protein
MSRKEKASTRTAWTTLACAVVLAVILTPPIEGKKKGNQPEDLPMVLDLPDLFQMTDRSEVVVLASVADIDRYADFAVEEVYSGNYELPNLSVIYRGMSWERQLDGSPSIRFKRGDRYLLFLRYHRVQQSVPRADLFELMDGDWGRMLIDTEGSNSPPIEAMRLLMGAAARPTARQKQAVIVGMLGSENQLAAVAAMSVAFERRLATPDEVPVLLGQMDRGIAALQFAALKILRRLGPTLPDSLNRESLAQAIFRRVPWNEAAPVMVRMEAISTLSALGTDAIPQLQEISRTDSAQDVRYRAAVAAHEIES